MLVIGLTGGIGSGKSTVAALFADYGIPIIDADHIARQLTKPGTQAFKDILAHFKENLLLPDGNLNRTALRHIIFTNQQERLWLEGLLHPLIHTEMESKIKNLTAPYCIAVIPLLLEVEFYGFINRILVVDASENSQIDRVAARDQAQKPQVEAILKAQASRDARLSRAHDVILNDGKLADLIPQVEKLHEKYLAISKAST